MPARFQQQHLASLPANDLATITSAVHQLRFRTVTDHSNKPMCLSFRQISAIVGLSTFKVKRILEAYEKQQIIKRRKPAARHLLAEHERFLVSSETLTAWRLKSLAQRCILFHRAFPDKRISVTKLREVYKRHKITYRSLTAAYHLTSKQQENRARLRKEVFPKIVALIDSQQPVFFCDESVFSNKLYMRRVWSEKGQRQPTIPIQRVNHQAIAAIASIDSEGKIIAQTTFDFSVDTEKFICYLEQLKAAAGGMSFTLCLDNMRAHHAKKVKDYCADNGIQLLFCPPYSSEFAPIERLWALSKVICRQKLIEGSKPKLSQAEVHELVRVSMAQSSQKALKSHVLRCRQRMLAWLEEQN